MALCDFANGESAHRVRLTTVEQIFAGAHGKGWTPASGRKGKGEEAKSAGKPDPKDKDAPPNSGGADEAKIKCYNCEQFGHKKAECPQKEKEKEQQPSWAKKAAGAAGSGAAGSGAAGSSAAGSTAAAGTGPSAASHGQGKFKSDEAQLIISAKDGSTTVKGTCRHCKMVDKHLSNFCPTAAQCAECKWRGGGHRNTCSSYIKPQQH